MMLSEASVYLLVRNSMCVIGALCAFVWKTNGRGLLDELESYDPVSE